MQKLYLQDELLAVLSDGPLYVRFVGGKPERTADIFAVVGLSLEQQQGVHLEPGTVKTLLTQLAELGLVVIAASDETPCAVCLTKQERGMRGLLFAPLTPGVKEAWTRLWDESKFETPESGVVHGFVAALGGPGQSYNLARSRLRVLFARGYCERLNTRTCLVMRPPGAQAKRPPVSVQGAITVREESELTAADFQLLVMRAWRLLWAENEHGYFDGALSKFLKSNLGINQNKSRRVIGLLQAAGAVGRITPGSGSHCQIERPPGSDEEGLRILQL